MSRKPKRGYFVRGQFVAEGSELDQEYKRELKGGDDPSKTDLKRASAERQALGEALLELRSDLLDALQLPDALIDALAQTRRITDFEGRRRQMQYIGKIMRRLDEPGIDAIRAALAEQHRGSAAETAALHAAEHWREQLIAEDASLALWLDQYPGTDAQQLRALIRQARKDAPPGDRDSQSRGLAPRQGRAYRELFQLVREHLRDSSPAADTP